MSRYKELAIRVHEANKKWWTNPRTGEPERQKLGKKLMLVVSELAECMEAVRKNLNDDKLPHLKGEVVEMADYVIRLLDIYGAEPHELDRPIKGGAVSLTLVERVEDGTYNELREFVNEILQEDKAEIMLHMVHQVAVFSRFPYLNDLAFLIKMAEMYCEKFGLDLWGAFEEKMAYNAIRADHQLENRIKEGGKEW